MIKMTNGKYLKIEEYETLTNNKVLEILNSNKIEQIELFQKFHYMYREFNSKSYIIHFINNEIIFPELFERAKFITQMANNGVNYS